MFCSGMDLVSQGYQSEIQQVKPFYIVGNRWKGAEPAFSGLPLVCAQAHTEEYAAKAARGPCGEQGKGQTAFQVTCSIRAYVV